MISARVEKASLNTTTNTFIWTLVLRYPLIIHGELMTHRVFSRNAASQRAVPCKTIRKNVLNDPFIPSYIGANQRGMQAGTELTGWRRELAKAVWGGTRYPVVAAHYLMEKLGVHKQITNRILIPWQWMETVVTATEFENFFKQRLEAGTEPHFYNLAAKMKIAMGECIFNRSYTKLRNEEVHLPFVSWDERSFMTLETAKKVSAARCARVSYFLPGTDKKSDVQSDIALCDRLISGGHWSPFEHVATAINQDVMVANLRSFRSYRKEKEIYG